MAYGFAAFNTAVAPDGSPAPEVIISDTYSCLHFIGKATIGTNDGGFFDQQNSSGTERSNFFPDFTGANIVPGATDELDGRVLINYSITTGGRPTAFIKPNNLAYDRWYAIVSQSEGASNLWTFQVLMSGIAADNFPELFIFVEAESVPESNFSGDTYGLIVQNANGEKTFDSRAQPLSILAAETQSPRDYAANDGTPVTTAQFSSVFACNYDDLDHDFHSNGPQTIGFCNNPPIAVGITEANCRGPQGGTNWTQQGDGSGGFSSETLTAADMTPRTDTPLTDLMFSVPAPYQAVWQRQAHGHNVGTSCFSTAAWWVMYRGANRLQPHATTPDAVTWDTGWATYAAGYNFSNDPEVANWDGIDTGGGGNTGSIWAQGVQPYVSGLSVNSGRISLMIVADSTIYT